MFRQLLSGARLEASRVTGQNVCVAYGVNSNGKTGPGTSVAPHTTADVHQCDERNREGRSSTVLMEFPAPEQAVLHLIL